MNTVLLRTKSRESPPTKKWSSDSKKRKKTSKRTGSEDIRVVRMIESIAMVIVRPGMVASRGRPSPMPMRKIVVRPKQLERSNTGKQADSVRHLQFAITETEMTDM